METDKKALEPINELIEMNFDHAKALSKVSADLAALGENDVAIFNGMSIERHQYATKLEEMVRAAGGDPPYEASMGSDLRRAWMNVKNSFTTDTNIREVLNECKHNGEQSLEAYQNALGHIQGLPDEIVNAIKEQEQGVREANEAVDKRLQQVG
ncbi:PA2169 family four-helix-bundle protein [Mucilaginibacter myungsuensis]|uniref:PA2169 family four-helix-bundle protein n=1 Tax=Mucilaginibacter myungsuensis TaxID=649104 RepID=A0A929PV36_9SPHI|nr:PA2169 family four-helix-bundle protein [Mucilaginibacter myungsuensis]MBE9660724.1 PA2169 family four-helix-bundle protein [Mucilaginibacter myungsuensis]MDN3600769.1 PA2169 family four-helix-bundle protein [Mucilaginibacter myungsuensis]